MRLAPGASRPVPYTEIGGDRPGATAAIAYWWHVVPDGAAGDRAGDTRSVVASLSAPGLRGPRACRPASCSAPVRRTT